MTKKQKVVFAVVAAVVAAVLLSLIHISANCRKAIVEASAAGTEN